MIECVLLSTLHITHHDHHKKHPRGFLETRAILKSMSTWKKNTSLQIVYKVR